MSELKTLRASRGYVKAKITRLSTQLFSDDGLQSLLAKKELLVKAFLDYEKINMSILALDQEDDENVGEVEDKYCIILASINSEIGKKSHNQTASSHVSHSNSKINLPAIQITPFTGKYSDYTPFINLFKSVINQDLSLDETAKLYYLRSFLKQEPFDLIKNLPLTNKGYVEALRLLDERYNNKYKIVSDHINALLDINVLSKSTPQNIRDFVFNVKQVLAALKNLETKVDTWDDIVLCVLIRKLDTYTARAYQLERDATVEPSVQQFLAFLEKRALALENAEPTALTKRAVVNVTTSTSSGIKITHVLTVLLPPEHPISSNSSPHVVNTKFGHIVAGALTQPTTYNNKVTSLLCTTCDSDVSESLTNFWKAEQVPEIFNENLTEHELAETIFQESVILENNNFYVDLPLKLPLEEINETPGNSFDLAYHRFLNLEKKLQKDPHLQIEYKDFINEFITLGHAELVDINSYDFNKDPLYFLPHHAVLNESSKTTKVRAVFDASMQTKYKVSLNDLMLNGPQVQRELFDIVLLFRFGDYTFSTDIQKMYRCVLLNPQFTPLQNILFRNNPDEKMQCLRLKTVTYGLKSSAFLATRCLVELTKRFGDNYPLGSFILNNCCYVDDILYADSNLNNIASAKTQLQELLRLGNFNAHKWASNAPSLLQDIPNTCLQFDELDLQKQECKMKALDLTIDIKNDCFAIKCPEVYDTNLITKKDILSYIARFYDPMGFVSPIIIKAKAIMQQLWLERIGWNEPAPASIKVEWLKFIKSLMEMHSILLNRNISVPDAAVSVQLIGFADAASTVGYGCCVYLRVVDATGKVTVALLCSKSRVNPISKPLTVPRLELNATLLLSLLVERVYNILKIKIRIDNIFLYSDSKIVLAWLRTELTRLLPYVANRVKLIKEKTGNCTWLYVNTQENPADLVSKGVDPRELPRCTLWWNGPSFLHSSMYSYEDDLNIVLPVKLPELKKLVVGGPNQRNWRGILIALLVIVAVLALIVTSVVLLTPPDEGPRVKGRRLRIQDLLDDQLKPVRWNGTWISGDEFVYHDNWGGISLMFAANQSSKTLMPNTTYRVLEPASFSLSADRRFLLLGQNLRKIHRHSYLARYTIYDILTTESYPLTPLPDEVGGAVINEGPSLLLATWTPKGHGLITVKDYDIYYRPAPRSSTGYRVTDTGIPGTIHNGVPDWLYEEEILDSRTALWMSADGHMIMYATFNDSLVHEQKYPWYGAALDTDDPAKTYPEIRSVRYPKPGTNNPTVTLTVADIADPKHIRTRHLTPPKVILEEGDYYFTSAQWVSLTEVCVVWLTRMQNLSVVTVCKSPMWYCQEVYRISSGSESWVESAPSPLWSAGGGALVTLAPVRDGPAGLFRHIVRTEHNAHGPRALPLTHGSFDVIKLLAWDHANQHIYYLGIPEGKPGQQHLYRVSSEAPRPGSPQKLPYCVTCNSQPSPSINLEYYGNLASTGESTWDNDWDEDLPATSPSTNKKKKKKYPDGLPQNLPCLYHEAHFSPSSAYFVLECLGPGVPIFSLYKTALPDPRMLLPLENNTAVKEKLSTIALPTPRTFSVQLSSGHAARVRLLLPPGLREDEVTKYPLVLKVHGAPGTQLVTERWSLDWGSLAAGAGAILASVDARGASGKGLGAHHTLHRRLGTVELADQLEVAEYLRESLHFIDARRVAVWGRAHGGFLATLALASSVNVFHCGIALTPIVRWRYYASAYAERYMGFPNATGNYRGYADADVTKQAAALHDKMLLLVHGTADNTVHMQQSMALARALADQGSMFRQQIYPDEGHSLEGVKRHLYRTMSAFLDDCFRKQVPPETKAGLRNGGNLD